MSEGDPCSMSYFQTGAGCGVATCVALLANDTALPDLAAMQAAKIASATGIPDSNLEALKITLAVRAFQFTKFYNCQITTNLMMTDR